VYGSKYLNAADIGRGGRYKIRDSAEEDVPNRDTGKSEEKTVVWLKGESKGWMLNKQNTHKLMTILGDDFDEWDGKFIVLVPGPYDFKGKTGMSIQVDVAGTRALNGPVAVTDSNGAPVLVGPRAESAGTEVSRRPQPALTQQEADAGYEDSGY